MTNIRTIQSVTALNNAYAALPKVIGTVSASGAAVVNKHNPVNASAAARSISLPTGQAEGTQVSVEKVDTSVNLVNVTGNIRGVGSSTLSLAWQYESIMFRADSAGSWWPIAGHKTKSALDAAFAPIKGANLPRTLGKLRAGQALKVGVIGDSKLAPGTPGNTETTSAPTAGDAVTKAFTIVSAWSSSTVTIPTSITNGAESGHTMARQFIEGDVATVLAAVPDLVIVEIGTNDSNSDANGTYAAGYPLAASLAALERACAYARDVNETCEFLFIATTPYAATSPSNAKLLAYNAALKSLAAVWGAELVDGYALFTALGTYDSLLYDSTHRNAAGNDVLAAEIARHFPQTGTPVAAQLAPRAVTGRYDITKVDKTVGNSGYYTISAQGSTSTGSFALNGSTSGYLSGWAASGTFDVTSTVNDYFELTGTKARELLANVDLGSASVGTSYPVVDVYLDGVLQAANVDLHAQSAKNTTNYWIPFVTGLDGASHTLKLVLKSGILRISSAAVVVGGTAAFTKETKVVDLGSGATATALPADGTYVAAVIDSVISLPSGWTSADVRITAAITLRVNGTTTTPRQVNVRVRHASTSQLSYLWDVLESVASGAVKNNGSMPINTRMTATNSNQMTANTQYRIDARVLSTDKTNCYITNWEAVATLVRTA